MYILLNIKAPLAQHPNQTAGGNEHWPCHTPPPRHRLEHEPLAHEMKPCDGVGANGELVDLRVGNVVSSVETDDGRDNGPGAEDPGGEWAGV